MKTTKILKNEIPNRSMKQLIALQVSNNATFQQAMDSGAVNSFAWWGDRP